MSAGNEHVSRHPSRTAQPSCTWGGTGGVEGMEGGSMSISISAGIVIIWGIFTLLFFIQSCRHWAKSKLPKESVLACEYNNKEERKGIVFPTLPFLLSKLDEFTKSTYKISALSYLFAGLVALFSFAISAYQYFESLMQVQR